MRAIDTNVLVRLIIRDEPAAQVGKAESFVAQGAWVSQVVLAETVWVLESVYGLSRRQVATVVAMLVEHDRLTLQDENVVRRAHAAFERGDGAAGFGRTVSSWRRLARRGTFRSARSIGRCLGLTAGSGCDLHQPVDGSA